MTAIFQCHHSPSGLLTAQPSSTAPKAIGQRLGQLVFFSINRGLRRIALLSRFCSLARLCYRPDRLNPCEQLPLPTI